MRRTRWAILAVLGPLATACAPTLRTSGSVRSAFTQSSTVAPAREIRLTPIATLSAGPRADAPSVEFAPELTLGGGSAASRAKLRASARWSDGGVAHPVLTASVEDGETRSAELSGDALTAVPAAAVVHSRLLRAGAALRFDEGSRLRVDARIDAEHSGGVGASANSLPTLVSLRAQTTARYDLTRRTTLEAGVQLSDERTGDAAALGLARFHATASTHLSRTGVLYASAGLVDVLAGGAPARVTTLELGGSLGDATDPHIAASLGRSPEVDRLTGSLRDRLRTHVRFETPLVSGVSFGATLQRAGDLDGFAQRVVSSGDMGFAVTLARGRRLDIGVARFLQSTGAYTTNAETRAVMQFTFAPAR